MERKVCLIVAFLALQFIGIAQVPFTAGNIVVYRIGTAGGSTLSNGAAPVFLDEYTITGTLVQTIAMPVTTSGSNYTLTAAGTGNTEGLITLSGDGQYLVLTGYNAPVGTNGIGGTSATARPRTIGLVRYDGNINTSTALTDLSSAGFVRCAVSTNGTDLWACGSGNIGTTGGVHYATVGATTSIQLTSTATYTGLLRCLNITQGQLYVSGNSNTPRIGSVGIGLPTTSGQTITNLPGMSETGTPGQFVLLDLSSGVPGPDVLYCADDADGIEKFSLVGGNWVSNGIVGASVDDYRGFTAKITGNTVTIYSTRRGSNSSTIKGGQLVSLTDASGYNGVFSATPVVLVTSATNQTAFRGVAAAPVLNVLPVRLVNFSANGIMDNVLLKWEAADAQNFSHFEVERSMDGMTFSVIATVNVQQTGYGNTYYHYTDTGILKPPAVTNKLYYRLKMVDNDGQTDYSKMVIVNVDKNSRMLVNAYPCPFNNEIFVKTEIVTAGKATLSLADVWGRTVKTMTIYLPAGGTTITFSPPVQLQTGTYFLRININDKTTTLKLFK